MSRRARARQAAMQARYADAWDGPEDDPEDSEGGHTDLALHNGATPNREQAAPPTTAGRQITGSPEPPPGGRAA